MEVKRLALMFSLKLFGAGKFAELAKRSSADTMFRLLLLCLQPQTSGINRAIGLRLSVTELGPNHSYRGAGKVARTQTRL